MNALIDKLIPATSPSCVEEAEVRARLMGDAEKAMIRFPGLFDESLYKILECLFANVPKNFLKIHSYSHLQVLLLAKFFLQKKCSGLLRRKGLHKSLFF